MIKLLILAVAITAVSCQYGGYHGHQDYYSEPHYNFHYSVHDGHTGDIKSHREERLGDRTRGEYSLVEPDGSLRLVRYSVEGKSGFLARVDKEPPKYRPQPGYRPPSLYHR